MKIVEWGQKKLRYMNKSLYVVNDIDDDLMNENTDFPIGSISKVFTAIVTLLLDQEGILNLKDPVNKYLPGKKLEGIKIIDLINHTSGLKRDSVLFFQGFDRVFKNELEGFNIYKKEKINSGEYGKYSYSNLGYLVLSALIEKVTGLDFDQVVGQKLFGPLDMKDTGYRKPKTVLYELNKKKITKKQQNEMISVRGSGSAISTVSDLLKFKKFHTLLDKKSISKLETFYFFNFDREENLWILKKVGLIYGSSVTITFKYSDDLVSIEERISFVTNIPSFID